VPEYHNRPGWGPLEMLTYLQVFTCLWSGRSGPHGATVSKAGIALSA
jgi:hypothetical protein